MATKNERMKPFMAVHPGSTLRYELEERGISQKAFAGRIGMSPSHFNEVVNGKRNITLPLAEKLERELGVSAMMWMNLQTQYEYDCRNQDDNVVLDNAVSTHPIHVGELIKSELSARGMKQRELADRTGLGSSMIAALLKGKRALTGGMALRLEEVLGIPAKKLMNYQVEYELDCARIRRHTANMTQTGSQAYARL